MAKKCKICGSIAVPPSGPKDSPILICGEFPGDTELEYGKPFVGLTGRVLREELALLGIDLRRCRLANLWVHEPLDPKHEHYDECLAFTQNIAIREANGRKGVLLLGSDCAKTFIRKNVMEVAGLRVEDDCDLFKAEVVVCSPNPASVFKKNGVVGEVRFALKQFADAVDEYI